jgi:large subunit ribosomal protein L15
VKEGVKVLGNGKENLTTPIHLEVTACSKDAIAAIEAAGGTVTCTHFNR